MQIDPEELVGLINNCVQSIFDDFVKGLPTNNPDEILTPSQVCELLQIDNSTLWRWSQKGKVKVYGIQSRRYYKKNELMNCLIPLSNPKLLKLNNLNQVA
ncbi:Helix-turn-helix domain protein [compost metagenome]